jgi:hypothetical protein
MIKKSLTTLLANHIKKGFTGKYLTDIAHKLGERFSILTLNNLFDAQNQSDNALAELEYKMGKASNVTATTNINSINLTTHTNMKKSILTVVTAGTIMAAIVSGCNSPTNKVENAKQDLKEAKQELNQAQQDSVADFEAFRKESKERIAENEKMIAAFKESMSVDKKQSKKVDQKMIDELEQRNINMRKKIEEYRTEGKDNWEAFKKEFNHDMDDLGKSIKNITVKNTK